MGVLGLWHDIALSDITGSFAASIRADAIPCDLLDELGFPKVSDEPCEQTLLRFGFETDLNITVTISGLTTSLHSHSGLTGFEDLILRLTATLGDLDIRDEFVFGQAFGLLQSLDGRLIPVCYDDGTGSCPIFFIKKRVRLDVTVVGLTFSNLALLEDINFPDPGALKPSGALYTTQSQAFGFGDIVTLEGRTDAGTTLTAQIGLCAEQRSNNVKQHSFSFTVNPHCLEGPGSSTLLLDFEDLSISNIALTDNIASAFSLNCLLIIACSFTNTLTLTGAPLFPVVTASLTVNDVLGTFAFQGVVLVLQSGNNTFVLNIDSTLALTSVNVTGNLTLNPDSSPASVNYSISGAPGSGLSSLILNVIVQRFGVRFSALVTYFASGGSATFSKLTLRAATTVGLINLEATTGFTLAALAEAAITASMSF